MGLRVEERIVAGAEGDDLFVHHLVLRGSNGAIGRHLCELVRTRYGVPVLPGERARPDERLHCPAAFVPPRLAGSGHPLVARAFALAGPLGRPRRGEPPAASRPYVLELHPDEGHPSLAVCAFELAGAALDGVNAEGLVAVAAPDLEAAPSRWLDALQVVRQLLDRCASAAEARAVLAEVTLDAAARPARWLVADRRGDAFVLEVPVEGPRRFVDAAGERLEVTPRCAGAPLRKLWQGEYDPVDRRLAARFFVAGEPGRGQAPQIGFQLR